ncbi:hypothetical protein BGW80DRAFT_1250162 [Lactifluus volemus]|nr:hypothetical protein BGW80DRAFT_1250162 [Lactifluus volemus]
MIISESSDTGSENANDSSQELLGLWLDLNHPKQIGGLNDDDTTTVLPFYHLRKSGYANPDRENDMILISNAASGNSDDNDDKVPASKCPKARPIFAFNSKPANATAAEQATLLLAREI